MNRVIQTTGSYQEQLTDLFNLLLLIPQKVFS